MKSFAISAILLAAALLGASCQHESSNILPASTKPAADLVTVGLTPADLHARTATHLAYVEDALRHKGTRRMPSHLRRRRYQALKLLHSYRTAGQFPLPSNASAGMQPCLRDAQGRVDAIGYLMQETGSRTLVDQISLQYPHARIETIDNPDLKHWVRMSGLTIEECALIQGGR